MGKEVGLLRSIFVLLVFSAVLSYIVFFDVYLKEDGPAWGAVIMLSNTTWNESKTVPSGSDPRINFTGISAGTYTILAQKDGYWYDIYTSPDSNLSISNITITGDQNFTLYISNTSNPVNSSNQSGSEPQNYTLLLRILNMSTGAPIENVSITLFGADVFSNSTNASGYVEFQLPPGLYNIIASYNGRGLSLYNGSEEITQLNVTGDLEITLNASINQTPTGNQAQGYNLTVHVLNFTDGQGIPNITVLLSNQSGYQVNQTTDENGTALFSNLSAGNYSVSLLDQEGNYLQFSASNPPDEFYAVYNLSIDNDTEIYLYVTSSGVPSGNETPESGNYSEEFWLPRCNGSYPVNVSVTLVNFSSEKGLLIAASGMDGTLCGTTTNTTNGTANVTLYLNSGGYVIFVTESDVMEKTSVEIFEGKEISVPENLSVNFTIVPGVPVNGTVTYNGNPVNGFIYFMNETNFRFGFARIENGTFNLTLTPGWYSFEIYPDDFSIPSYKGKVKINDSGNNISIDLANVPGAKIIVNVSMEGNPVDGYAVLYKKINDNIYDFSRYVEFSNGNLVINGISEEGVYILDIYSYQGHFKEVDNINVTQEDIQNNSVVYNGTIDFSQGLRIYGWVRNENGNPIQNVPVIVTDNYMRFYYTETNGSGYYVVYGLSNDTKYTVEVHPDWIGEEYTPESKEVYVTNESKEVNFTLQRGVNLTGYVDGIDTNLCHGFCGWVSTWTESAYAFGFVNGSGNITLTGLIPNETYTVVISLDPALGKPDIIRNVRINQSGNYLVVNASGSASQVKGRVLYNNNPVSGADVYLYSDYYGWYARTDGNGEFEFRNVPEGTYHIEVHHPTYAPYISEVNISGSETTLPDISLSAGYTWSGYVIDASGSPVLDAWVELWNENTWRYSETDENGHFSIGGLSEGTYEYYVSLPSGEWKRGEVSIAGNTIRNITFGSLHQVTVQVTNDTSLSNIHIDIYGDYYSNSTVTNRTSITFSLPEGNYTVVAWADGTYVNFTNITIPGTNLVSLHLEQIPQTNYTLTVTVNANNAEAYYVVVSGNGLTFYNKSQSQNTFTFEVPAGNYTVTGMVMIGGSPVSNSTDISVTGDSSVTINIG